MSPYEDLTEACKLDEEVDSNVVKDQEDDLDLDFSGMDDNEEETNWWRRLWL